MTSGQSFLRIERRGRGKPNVPGTLLVRRMPRDAWVFIGLHRTLERDAPTATGEAFGRLRAFGALATEYNARFSFDVTQTTTPASPRAHDVGAPRHSGRVRCADPGSQRRRWERSGRRRRDESPAKEIQ